jgi:hypothetical protein
MYKKLVTFLVFSLYVPLVALGADDPSRARLYIPASTSTTVSGCTTCELKVSGYAARYIFGFGLGLGVASSKLAISGDPKSADYSLDTGPMMDIGYTFGSDFTFTFGLGVGSSPTSDKFIPDVNYKIEGTSALTSFFGLGYSFGSIEILLALRNSSAKFDESYNISVLGMSFAASYANEYQWQTTDIGIGFTF